MSETSLSQFCSEMQRLASIIDVRPDFLPTCGGPHRDGFRVEADGPAFRLIYSEKGMSDVLFESADTDAVMEQVFVLVTQRAATEDWSRSRSPITSEEMASLGSLPIEEKRRMAEAIQSNEAAIQFRLMTRLNPQWGERQLKRNVERKRHIQTFFEGDRP